MSSISRLPLVGYSLSVFEYSHKIPGNLGNEDSHVIQLAYFFEYLDWVLTKQIMNNQQAEDVILSIKIIFAKPYRFPGVMFIKSGLLNPDLLNSDLCFKYTRISVMYTPSINNYILFKLLFLFNYFLAHFISQVSICVFLQWWPRNYVTVINLTDMIVLR